MKKDHPLGLYYLEKKDYVTNSVMLYIKKKLSLAYYHIIYHYRVYRDQP